MISSLAGRAGNAFNVPYGTTKAGLVGCTRSLRAELEGTPVGASVICPGFIANDGMYADIQREFGVNASVALRAVDPERVADAVVQAATDDRPDMLITGWPMRPLLAIQELAPRVAERLTNRRHWRAAVLPDGRRAHRSRPRDRNGRERRPQRAAVGPERAARVARRYRREARGRVPGGSNTSTTTPADIGAGTTAIPVNA